MQQHDNFCFLQVLRVPFCELWQVKDRRGNCKARGALQVLYSRPLNLFLLKFNDFYFALDRNLQVTGTYSETAKCHSYLLPTFSGFYIIKALESQPGPLLTNLETILGNATHYSQRTGLEEPLGLYSSDEVHDIEVRKSGMSGGFSRLGEAFSKMMAPSSEWDTHPNQRYVRSFADLIDVDNPGIPVVDVPTDHVENFKLEMKEIIKNHQGATEWKELRGEEKLLKAPETGIRSELGMMGPWGLELRGAGAGLLREEKREETSIGGSKTLNREDQFTKIEQNQSQEQSHHHHLFHHEHKDIHHHHHLGVDFLHRQQSHGADNILTCQHETGQDQQEVVGMENQRLPSYEIENPKEHLVRGFRKASINLGDPTEAKLVEESTETPGSRIEEVDETDFTTGLFSNHQEVLSRSKENLDQASPAKDLSKENLRFEKWGSNITNASESTIKEDPFTGQNLGQNLGFPLGTRTHFGDPGFTKENLENLNPQTTTSILQEKTNVNVEQKQSEKSKSKSVTQAVDKENVGGSYVI